MQGTPKRLIAAQISDLRTTTTGGPVGQLQPNLQMTELDPGGYTVQFQVYPPDPTLALGFSPFAAQAIVNWKVKGQQIRRVLSVYSGAVISGEADAVDIQLQDVLGTLSSIAPPGRPYKIGAILSRGTRPTTMQPPFLVTTSPSNIGPNSSGVLNIPQDSGVISVLLFASQIPVTAPAIAPTDVVLQQASAFLPEAPSYYPLQQPGLWFPIFPGSLTIAIRNNNAAQTIVIQPFWGIEG